MGIMMSRHFGIARKIVSNMTSESWETVPHACLTMELEVTAFMAELEKINSGKSPDDRISVNTAMLRVICEGLAAAPEMNGHIVFSRRFVRGRVDIFDHIDVSLPVMLPNGEMMTLNIRDLGGNSLTQIRDKVRGALKRAENTDLTEVMFEASMHDTLKGLSKGRVIQAACRLIGAKLGKNTVKTLSGEAKREYYSRPEHTRLTKRDIEQGTITVSNLGSICRSWDGACTILEIIPPQVAALAIGAVSRKAVVDPDGTIRPGLKMPITVAVDHRALDMCDVTPFMERVTEIFAEPAVISDWL